MRPAPLVLLPLGIGLGVAAEGSRRYEDGALAVAAADLGVGCVLISCGVVAWARRPESRFGALASLAGLTWFLGTLFEPLLYLHRGPLTHLLLAYPTGRLPTRLARIVVFVAYAYAAIEPVAANDAVTLVLSGVIAATAVRLFLATSGPARKAGGRPSAAALAFAGVLALGSVGRLGGWFESTPPSGPTTS